MEMVIQYKEMTDNLTESNILSLTEEQRIKKIEELNTNEWYEDNYANDTVSAKLFFKNLNKKLLKMITEKLQAIKFANVLSLIIKNLELFYKSLECFECHTAQIHRNPPRYRHPSKLPTGTTCT